MHLCDVSRQANHVRFVAIYIVVSDADIRQPPNTAPEADTASAPLGVRP